MMLKKQYEAGVNLSDEEIKELVTMYKSGWYFISEICEWFGLTNYEFKAYLKIAKEKGYETAR